MEYRTHTLTAAGVSLFAKWYEWAVTMDQSADRRLVESDGPHLTERGYASLYTYFRTQGPNETPAATCHLHPKYSRVVGTAEFIEFLDLNSAVFLDAGVIRLTRLSTNPSILARTNRFFMLNWTPTSTATVHNPIVRDIAVAYRPSDDSAVATWFFGQFNLDTRVVEFEDGSRDTLHLTEDEYVIDAQAIEWLREWPDAIFIRLNQVVPVLYSRQQATVAVFKEDLTSLTSRVVMDGVDAAALGAYTHMTVRSFMQAHSPQFLLPQLLTTPCTTST